MRHDDGQLLWDRLLSARGGAESEERWLSASVETLLAELSVDEKLHCLSGDTPLITGGLSMALAYNVEPIPAGAIPRLGIPGVRFADGPRGCVLGESTAFPVPMARGATFDPELETRVAETIAREIRAQGGNLFAGICINLLRHPGWGRAQETYGEDGLLLGRMGVAAVVGSQRHLMACIKHFALNSIENSRFKVDVRVDGDTLREIFLPHFRRCVEAGAAAVMSSYNKVNGVHASQNVELLTDILRGEWGFTGFVMSDFVFGVRDAPAAIHAGNDLEMPFTLRSRGLRRAMRRERLSTRDVDVAVGRILREQLRFAEVGDPVYPPSLVGSRPRRELAREVAERSVVLLENDPPRGAESPLLPLSDSTTSTVAVIGRLASMSNTGDKGSSAVRSPDVVSIADGISSIAANGPVDVITSLSDDPVAGAAVAARSDVAVLVVGYTHRDEGEFLFTYGGDRADLRLRDEHERLICEVVEANRRTVVLLVGGSPIVCESWRAQVPAILMGWYSGVEGGNAVARVLFGKVEPSGRLPCTWARSAAQLPDFDPKADEVTYGPLCGYRLFAANDSDPAWWFGYGLSYTHFRISDVARKPPQPPADGEPGSTPPAEHRVGVTVSNMGSRPGRELLQTYVDVALGSDRRAVQTLCGFTWVELEPGATTEAVIELDAELMERAEALGEPVLRVGTSADPTHLKPVM